MSNHSDPCNFFSSLLASAQLGGNLSPNEPDTIKPSFLNPSTYEFYNHFGLLNRIHYKKGEILGFTEIYQNGVLVEKSRYKNGVNNGRSEMYYTNGIKHKSVQYRNGLHYGKYKEY